MEVAIIGGGASGMMCAVAIRRKSKKINVTVYEKLPRVLKKILVTGNGRCNITNINAVAGSLYRGDAEFADAAIKKYDPQSNMDFFESIGLMTKTEDEGRVYPMSSQASSVVSALMCEAERLGVKTVNGKEITFIKKKLGRFILNNEFTADCVVIAAGGSAAKVQGTDGASFRLLESLGIEIVKPKPALTALNARNFTQSLKGVRNISNVKLFIDSKQVYEETGEVQFTDYGLSGIPIMQLSGLAARSTSDNITLVVDSLPCLSEEQVLGFIENRQQKNPLETAEYALCGILPKALGNHLMLLCDIKKDSLTGDLSANKVESLAKLIKFWEIGINSVRGFDFAQVTSGGADCREFDRNTFESKKIENLYCTGEALNVDGLCGGYNLQWAWSSARACADAVCVKENKLAENK